MLKVFAVLLIQNRVVRDTEWMYVYDNCQLTVIRLLGDSFMSVNERG